MGKGVTVFGLVRACLWGSLHRCSLNSAHRKFRDLLACAAPFLGRYNVMPCMNNELFNGMYDAKTAPPTS